MPTKESAILPEVYQIKVTLLGTSPPIWRRLLVPADATLAQLHGMLQVAMGGEDDHLHEFCVGQRRFGPAEPGDFMGMSSAEDEREAPLFSVLGRSAQRPGTRMILATVGSIALSSRSA